MKQKIFVVLIDYKKGLSGMIKNGVWMSAQEAFQLALIITTKQCLNTIRIELMSFT